MGGELRSTNTYYKIFRLGICRWCTKISKMCDTVAEAQSYVDSTVNSAEVINLGLDHSIGYGLDTVEV